MGERRVWIPLRIRVNFSPPHLPTRADVQLRLVDFCAAALVASLLMAPLTQTSPIPWQDQAPKWTQPAPSFTEPAQVDATWTGAAPIPDGLFRLLSQMGEDPSASTATSAEAAEVETAIENRWTDGDPRRQKALRKVLRSMASRSATPP